MSLENQHKADKVKEGADFTTTSLHKRHSLVGLSLALIVVGMLGRLPQPYRFTGCFVR